MTGKAAQPDLGAEARRRRVEKVRQAAKRLEQVENGLADLAARLPSMQREVQGIREQIDRALAGNDDEE